MTFVFTPLNIIDLCAVAPWWLSLIAAWPLAFTQILRALRLVRVLRLLRLAQASAELAQLGSCINASLPVLRLLLFLLSLELIVVGGLVFHAERGQDVRDGVWVTADGEEAAFQSILDAACAPCSLWLLF